MYKLALSRASLSSRLAPTTIPKQTNTWAQVTGLHPFAKAAPALRPHTCLYVSWNKLSARRCAVSEPPWYRMTGRLRTARNRAERP